ncbi:hypothetical protein ACFLWN_03805 [Chloroflexota bacterium]
MAKILGLIAGILLLVLLVTMFLPITTETKMVSIIFIWIALVIFTGASALTFLPNIATKIASGIVTAAIVVWAIWYLPTIISIILSE